MDKIISAEAKMKKILILSYHFPPLNVIASQRAMGYAKHLKKHGYDPTILTFDWNKSRESQYCTKESFKQEIIEETNEFYKVIRIPVLQNNFLQRMATKEGGLIYKLWILWCWFSGKLDVHPNLIEYGNSEEYYVDNFVKKGDYDLALGIYSPHFHLKNCYRLKQKLGIPFVLDFRDLWDNKIVLKDYLGNKLQGKYFTKFWSKWIASSSHFLSVSKPLVRKLEEFSHVKGTVATNGFEVEENVKNSKAINNSKFVIAHTGSVYLGDQRIEVLLEGIQQFSVGKEDNIEVKFIGLKKGRSQELEDIINSYIPSEICSITERIPLHEAKEQQRNADVLIFPTTPGVPGICSGKIYEYMNSGTFILAAPYDVEAVGDLINDTKTGKVVDGVAEVSKTLEKLYDKWNKQGNIKFAADMDRIHFYSRDAVVGRVAVKFDELINKE